MQLSNHETVISKSTVSCERVIDSQVSNGPRNSTDGRNDLKLSFVLKLQIVFQLAIFKLNFNGQIMSLEFQSNSIPFQDY